MVVVVWWVVEGGGAVLEVVLVVGVERVGERLAGIVALGTVVR